MQQANCDLGPAPLAFWAEAGAHDRLDQPVHPKAVGVTVASE